MGTVATDRWIKCYIEAASKSSFTQKNWNVQMKTIIEPVSRHFHHLPVYNLHRLLLEQGLFTPDQDVSPIYTHMRKLKMWAYVQKIYSELKREWEGPSVKIIILPGNETNEIIMDSLGGKMGIGFVDKVILFVTSKTNHFDLRTLLTHEYNHSCRLMNLNKRENELTLLDSLIVEGLAEYGVREKCGKRALGKWHQEFSKEKLQHYWDHYYRERIGVKGKHYHRPFLFGSEAIGIPLWTGYAIGFEIVCSMMEQKQHSIKKLLSLDSEIILKESSFKD
ncbi:DUF2268 domain-containing protein [Alkalihalobacterium elongatum]|uniref:DUF2268 domain-containing protein n=1 Tax=Alkalihalobacterium elongatum TaxID=2675466 RepID=UPI001C1F8094|nr:DUF2268 domain-containing putative Zn-dependent protease [Alkalihalobacterium elongatum]